MSGLTVPETKLKGPGGYTTNTPTLKPGAGNLKPFGGGTPDRVQANAATPFKGKRGSNKDTDRMLKNVPRVVDAPPTPPEEPEAPAPEG